MRRVLAGLIAALLAAGGYLGYQAYHGHQLTEAAKAASQQGKTAVTNVLSYDYQTLDADLAEASKGLTPDFRNDFAQVAAKSVKPVAAKDRVVTSATVPAVSVTDGTRNTVHLLMFVDQLTSSAKEKNVVNVSRVQVTMKKSGSGWLVSDLRAV